MKSSAQVAHLVRRFVGSLSRRQPSGSDVAWALDQLLGNEAMLWQRMSVQDRRHSLVVARRFVERADSAGRAEIAGALLHDVGKSASGLGTFARVVATVVGPRTERFRSYFDHEALGVAMLRDAGSEPATLAVIDGTSSFASALRDADAI